MGYSRAISKVKAYSKSLTNSEQMDEIPNVGDGIKKKVKEFMERGKITKLQELKSDDKV